MAVSSTTSSQLPGPPSVPLLGIYGNVVPFFRDLFAYMRGLHARYGDITPLAQGRSRYVFVFSMVQRYPLVLPRAARVDHAGLAFSYLKGGMPVLPVPQDRRFRQLVVRGNVRAWGRHGMPVIATPGCPTRLTTLLPDDNQCDQSVIIQYR
jgi:hypothetical protein